MTAGASIAHVIPPHEAPCDSWNEAIIAGWYHRDGDTDWLYVPKTDVPRGREIGRAFLQRCMEELKPIALLVDGVNLDAYSWHETTMMMHGYRAMHRDGSLFPVNFVFGTLCDAMVTADVARANAEMAAMDAADKGDAP
ncbi:MAG: hypothetical protein WDO74_22320 [Pseudomonadota bacterium]